MRSTSGTRGGFFSALLIFSLWLGVAAGVWAGGKAGEDAVVSFHLETEHAENPKLVFSLEIAGQMRHFRRMAEITTSDIAAFRPFPGDDGANSYGVIFKLKNPASRRLTNITTANQGKMMVAMANGRVIDAVRIDQPVNDGYIVIWKGLTEADIKLYDKEAPRIGEEKKKRGR